MNKTKMSIIKWVLCLFIICTMVTVMTAVPIKASTLERAKRFIQKLPKKPKKSPKDWAKMIFGGALNMGYHKNPMMKLRKKDIVITRVLDVLFVWSLLSDIFRGIGFSGSTDITTLQTKKKISYK